MMTKKVLSAGRKWARIMPEPNWDEIYRLAGRRINRRGQQQGALKEFKKALAHQGCFLAGVVGIRPELVFIARQKPGTNGGLE
jgi:hypothetical protein